MTRLLDRSHVFRLAGSVALAVLAGCASGSPPPVELLFDRDDPESALLGCVYAMETGDWEWAFETLDQESREAIGSPFWFKWGTMLEDVPDIGRPIYDVVVEAIRFRVRTVAMGENRRAIEVFYMEPDPVSGEYFPRLTVEVILVFQEGGWRLDLLRTASLNFGDLLEAR